MRLSAMGDVAMTVPVLRALVHQYPEVQITVISRPFFASFFRGMPNVSFFAFDAKNRHQGFLGLLRLFQDLKKLQIDAFADLHNVLRSKIIRTLFAISGIKVAFTDKGRADKAALTRVENKVFQPIRTMFERHSDVFLQLGFAINLSNPIFPQKEALSPEIISLSGIKKGSWIGVAPFAQYDSKVYPLDLMREVLVALSKDPSYKIFLFGGGTSEIELLNTLAANLENTIVIAGKIKFSQELELIHTMDIMLSMDSGNAHIAAMLGVKVITLWGATHPYSGFAPFNQSQDSALVSDRDQYPKLPTSLYGNKTVPGYENVMRTILPNQVVEKIRISLK